MEGNIFSRPCRPSGTAFPSEGCFWRSDAAGRFVGFERAWHSRIGQRDLSVHRPPGSPVEPGLCRPESPGHSVGGCHLGQPARAAGCQILASARLHDSGGGGRECREDFHDHRLPAFLLSGGREPAAPLFFRPAVVGPLRHHGHAERRPPALGPHFRASAHGICRRAPVSDGGRAGRGRADARGRVRARSLPSSREDLAPPDSCLRGMARRGGRDRLDWHGLVLDALAARVSAIGRPGLAPPSGRSGPPPCLASDVCTDPRRAGRGLDRHLLGRMAAILTRRACSNLPGKIGGAIDRFDLSGGRNPRLHSSVPFFEPVRGRRSPKIPAAGRSGAEGNSGRRVPVAASRTER